MYDCHSKVNAIEFDWKISVSLQSCQDDVTNALYQKCKEAVLAKRRAIYVIEGDAGTGKTAILQQALVKLFSDEKVIRDARILFCSATNLSLNHVNYVIYEKRRDFPKKFGM